MIQDILSATVVVPSVEVATAAYTEYFGYVVRETGRLEAEYCAALDATALVGARYVVLGSPDGSPGALRFIEDPATVAPEPLLTYGWSALEITVRDSDELCHQLNAAGSPYHHYSGPADLVFQAGPPGQRAFQTIGPSGEMLYLTQILRQNPKYTLPTPGPGAEVGRLFIMVLNTANYLETMRFYTEVVGMVKSIEVSIPLRLVNAALNLPPDTAHMLATVQTTLSTMIEVDGYSVPAHPRPTLAGHLPPLAALLTLATTDFDGLIARLQTAGIMLRYHKHYSPTRAVVFAAPGGELLELVEILAN